MQMERAGAFDPGRVAKAVPNTPDVVFTYAHPGQSWVRRVLIGIAEVAAGRNRLERLYRRWQADLRDPGESIFAAAVRELKLIPRVVAGSTALIPRTGGLLVVANHPYGIADGLLIGHLVSSRRRDVKLMVNSQLCQPPEAREVLLPVDFSRSPEARRVSAETRRTAVQWLEDGHVLIIFPAGGVSTAPKPMDAQAVDSAWHPFVARLATRPGVRTLPVFVHGQNSRLFQIASHFSYSLRVALIFRETVRRMGRPIRMAIGAPVFCAAMAKDDVVPHLRGLTYGMAGPDGPAPDKEFVWPARVVW
jgi:putative hemolysin